MTKVVGALPVSLLFRCGSLAAVVQLSAQSSEGLVCEHEGHGRRQHLEDDVHQLLEDDPAVETAEGPLRHDVVYRVGPEAFFSRDAPDHEGTDHRAQTQPECLLGYGRASGISGGMFQTSPRLGEENSLVISTTF